MIGKMLPGMIGPGTMPKSPMQPRAKERKERRAKEKASLASMMAKMEKEAPRQRRHGCRSDLLHQQLGLQ